jgi:hypothetical protein
MRLCRDWKWVVAACVIHIERTPAKPITVAVVWDAKWTFFAVLWVTLNTSSRIV